MKLSYIFLISIISLSISAQTCDSARIILHSYHHDADVIWNSLEIDSIHNQQIISSTVNFWDPVTQTFSSGSTSYIQWDTIGNQIYRYEGILRLTYEYDSFGRLIALDSASFDGTNWITDSNIDYYFTAMGTDSLKLRYGFVNSVFMLAETINWTYDSLDRIIQKSTEAYVNNVWQVTEEIRTDYSSILPGVVRVDSVYLYISASLVLTSVNAYSYNTPDSARYAVFTSPFNIMFPAYSYFVWNECGHTQWERLFPEFHSSFWEYADFDSLCRYTHFESGEATMTMGRQSDCLDYYYVDCNTMIGFISSNKNNICGGDTVELAVNIYGGTPPYSYQWISTGAISNDSVSHPFANPSASASYICTVTDSNFISWTDTVFIHVDPFVSANIYLLSIDNFSLCSSAELATSVTPGTYFSWYRDGISIYNPDTILHVIYNGLYTIHVGSGICPIQTDTINLTQLNHPSPFVFIEEGCNQLIAHSNSPSTFEWHMSNDTNSFYSGDTLSFTSSWTYNVFAIDGSGCVSEKAGQFYEHYSITPNFIHACNDSCFGEASVSVLPYYSHYSYLWTNGDTTSYADSLCNNIIGITVTNRLGCVLIEIDSCLNISVPEIDLNDESILHVYPNPSTGVFSFSSKDNNLMAGEFYIRIFNLIGEEVFSFEYQQLNGSLIDISSQPGGIYQVMIVSSDKRYSSRIIKN